MARLVMQGIPTMINFEITVGQSNLIINGEPLTYVAYCDQWPSAMGFGRTDVEAVDNLLNSIAWLMRSKKRASGE